MHIFYKLCCSFDDKIEKEENDALNVSCQCAQGSGLKRTGDELKENGELSIKRRAIYIQMNL